MSTISRNKCLIVCSIMVCCVVWFLVGPQYDANADWGQFARHCDWRACLSLTMILTVLTLTHNITQRRGVLIITGCLGFLSAVWLKTAIWLQASAGYYEPGDGLRPLEYPAFATFVTMAGLGIYLLTKRQDGNRRVVAALLVGASMLVLFWAAPFSVTSEWEHPSGSVYRGYGVILTSFNAALGAALILKELALLAWTQTKTRPVSNSSSGEA